MKEEEGVALAGRGGVPGVPPNLFIKKIFNYI
jgi:hypothetical protein